MDRNRNFSRTKLYMGVPIAITLNPVVLVGMCFLIAVVAFVCGFVVCTYISDVKNHEDIGY